MEMTHSDVALFLWNSPASSAGNTKFYLSRSVSAKQSGPKPGAVLRCGQLVQPTQGWQNWMAAYLSYTLWMKMLFRGWLVMVH